MKSDVCFMALGGGDRVGASCYYLRLGEANLLLDCGVGIRRQVVYGPDFYPLLTLPFLQSLRQISQVVISHAHADHVAFLPEFLGQAGDVPVFMTEMTRLFSEYQLCKRDRAWDRENGPRKLAAKEMLERAVTVNYFRKYEFGAYRMTFFPAGHIPGAMMTLIEYGGRQILYTGDYSAKKTALTQGCILPDQLHPDLLILCGLHAADPSHVGRDDGLERAAERIFRLLGRGKPVYCRAAQLSKGVELLKVLNDRNKERKIRIFLEDEVMEAVRRLERLGVPVFAENDHSLRDLGRRAGPAYLVIGGRRLCCVPDFYEKVNVDFSLHEGFDEVRQFIRKLNPRLAVVVHCARGRGENDVTVEQALMRDASCRTQFLFAREKELYLL